MGTRSCIIVAESSDAANTGRARTSEVHATLYRHWDGYPAIGGRFLAFALCASQGTGDLVRFLLSSRSEGVGHPRHDYELTTTADEHGDLEHVYRALRLIAREPDTMKATTSWIVEHYERPAGCWDGRADDYRDWPMVSRTLDEFEAFAIEEERQLLQRAAARNALVK